MTAVGIVENAAIPHRSIRERILRDMRMDTRQELHHRAAAVLYKRGHPAATIAEHLLGAVTVRFTWAPAVLLAGAKQEVGNDRVDRATACLDLAYRLSHQACDRAAIAVSLVATEWRTNPSTRTRHFTRLIAAVGTGLVPARDLPLVIRYLLWHGRRDKADLALDQLCGNAKDTTLPAHEFHTLDTWLKYTHPEHHRRHRGSLRLRSEMGPARGGDPRGGSARTEVADLLEGTFSGQPLEVNIQLAHHILAHSRLTMDTVEALVTALTCLLIANQLDAAATWADALLAESEARGAPTWKAAFASLRADAALRQGDLHAAAQYATAALNAVPAGNLGVQVGLPLAILVRALTARGHHEQAAAQLKRPVPAAMLESRFCLPYLHARGHHLLALGRTEDALRDFHRCGELMQRWQMDVPGLVPWRNDTAEAYLRLGDRRRAQTFATLHLDRPGCGDHHRTDGVSLRILALTSTVHQRIPLLRDSTAIARAGGDRYEMAMVLAELGKTHRSIGDRTRARTLTRNAARLAESCGADALLEELDPVRTQHVTPVPTRVDLPRTIDSLSPAEFRVAELAADGKRNSDIARTLDITTSTVEQHLTRVYRKLNVARRTELTFVLLADSNHRPNIGAAG
ncbi:LuxR C-terminal-related transcriptional regulator [Nocardia sp. CDC159]|uniref:LuxR C-terminal-related transcriptional regulator n=1 Tax=Nocardia pulmonis TaxID=2951408 RepID=A0A9X2E9A5_9NOCA|nr:MULTISPECIES: LuxR C-terminal-related transcriptional regulator [Nocardia]MCM6776652.1 LuxR C-terminal-related transcriptional regulator [Nocardia pulmonis]MCM6789199.1 LuxR C-terminal-related transcriptional regulator [Nocardia sp. CDC159]